MQANGIFLRLLSLDSSTSLTARDVTRAKRLKKAEGLLKSFFGNSLHLLGKLLQDPEGRAVMLIGAKGLRQCCLDSSV